MNNLKVGQEVLIKARVVEHNKHDKAIAIKKQGGIYERLVYVDEESIISSQHMTTIEFILRVKALGFDVNFVNGINNNFTFSNHNGLNIEFDAEDIAYVSLEREMLFRLRYEIDTYLDDNILSERQVKELTNLLIKYAQTPVEFRG